MTATKCGVVGLGSMDTSLERQWMRWVLRAAAIYNLVWGAWVILFPLSFFSLTGMEPINHPSIWQGMGMVIGVYGLGYWWASYHPIQQWPIILVGFLGKVFGPIGFVFNYLQGKVPLEFCYTMPTNDLMWWIPFFLILRAAYRTHRFRWRVEENQTEENLNQ